MPNAIRIPSLRLTELDGSPDIQGVEHIYLTSGFLSNLGGGNALLSLSGSAGNATYTSVYASRPSPSNAGDLFLPSDSFYLQRDTGAVWSSWGPIFQLTEPVSTDFAAVNFTGSTLTTANGAMHISSPSNGSAQNLRIQAKTLPAAPYTLTICFCVKLHYLQFSHAFVGVRNSGNDDAVIFKVQNDSSTLAWTWEKWTSNSSGGAAYIAAQTGHIMPWPYIWLQICDDNANRILRWSTDSINYENIHSVGRTDHVTPDQFCFGTNPYDQISGITLLSYKETTP